MRDPRHDVPWPQMLSLGRVTLNQIATQSTVGLVQAVLDAGVNVVEAYVDTVGAADRYAQILSDKFPGIRFTVESKADATYPIVGAASIAAKVTRDRETEAFAWKERFEDGAAPSTSFGSGYPSDPVTKAWMAGSVDPVFGFPSFVRFSWETCERALKDG